MKILKELEAAEYLRISVGSLRKRRRNGEIPFLRMCGVKYLKQDLDRFIGADERDNAEELEEENLRLREKLRIAYDALEKISGCALEGRR